MKISRDTLYTIIFHKTNWIATKLDFTLVAGISATTNRDLVCSDWLWTFRHADRPGDSRIWISAGRKEREAKKVLDEEKSIARSHTPAHKQGWRQGLLRRRRKPVGERYGMPNSQPSKKLIANPR
jgi:hypothetical protein